MRETHQANEGERVFQTIMTPVDLSHVESLERSLKVTADLANHYGASVTYVAVTTETPSAIAHTPKEFAARLQAFAEEQGKMHGFQKADARAYASHDPTADLNKTLLKAVKETGADLVVMASHKPGLPEYLFTSHAGYVATHAGVSVFVVR